MSLTTKAVLAVAVLLLCMGGTVWLANHERGIGRDQQRAADQAEQVKVAAVGVAKAETVLVAKTDTFTRWQTRTVALHDTVLRHLTDTLLVKQYVATSDSTIRACSDVILSCDTVRARYRELVSKDSTLAAIPKPNAGFFASLKARTGVYVGYGLQLDSAHVVRHGVQVGVGIKVWP